VHEIFVYCREVGYTLNEGKLCLKLVIGHLNLHFPHITSFIAYTFHTGELLEALTY